VFQADKAEVIEEPVREPVVIDAAFGLETFAGLSGCRVSFPCAVVGVGVG
jgi:hypothetical protein